MFSQPLAIEAAPRADGYSARGPPRTSILKHIRGECVFVCVRDAVFRRPANLLGQPGHYAGCPSNGLAPVRGPSAAPREGPRRVAEAEIPASGKTGSQMANGRTRYGHQPSPNHLWRGRIPDDRVRPPEKQGRVGLNGSSYRNRRLFRKTTRRPNDSQPTSRSEAACPKQTGAG